MLIRLFLIALFLILCSCSDKKKLKNTKKIDDNLPIQVNSKKLKTNTTTNFYTDNQKIKTISRKVIIKTNERIIYRSNH